MGDGCVSPREKLDRSDVRLGPQRVVVTILRQNEKPGDDVRKAVKRWTRPASHIGICE
jgi:hypothetical protein